MIDDSVSASAQRAVRPAPDRAERFAELIQTNADDLAFAALRAAETTDRPLASADFVADLESRLGRLIARRAPGRKSQIRAEGQPSLL